MTVLEGRLADRGAWSSVGHCPIERALDVLGPKNALLLLREASYGTTRFDDFAARVGITEAAAAARLRDLVAQGLLERRPYREPGSRTRDEYVLTEAGRDLLPALAGLFAWGQRHGGSGQRLQLVHHGCDAPAHVELRCSDGHVVGHDELGLRLRPRPA